MRWSLQTVLAGGEFQGFRLIPILDFTFSAIVVNGTTPGALITAEKVWLNITRMCMMTYTLFDRGIVWKSTSKTN